MGEAPLPPFPASEVAVLHGNLFGESQPPKSRPRRPKTPPPDSFTDDEKSRLRHFVRCHRPEVRALEPRLLDHLERCLIWHHKHDTRHRSWYAVAQQWLLLQPDREPAEGTEDDGGWGEAAERVLDGERGPPQARRDPEGDV